MKYFFTKLSAVALTASSFALANDAPLCNPAIQCPGISMECVKCNVRTDPNCDIDNVNGFGDGLCVEPAALDFKGKVYGMELTERCRRVVDPSWASVKPTPKAEDYVRSCREGEYTCNDGTCELGRDFPKRCYRGIKDDPKAPADDEHQCNVAKDIEAQQALVDFWTQANEEKHAYCANNGGVRYGPFRCSLNVPGITIQEVCPPGQEPKPPTCSDEGDVVSLFGPSDACLAQCNPNKDLHDHPGCCIDKDVQVCSKFTVYEPSEEVPRCSDEELNDEKCKVCQTPQSFLHPYCCMDGNGYPSCVDADGFDVDGKSTDCQGNNGLKGDVCYVDSSGSTAQPPPVSDTGYGAKGVVLTFEFEKEDELDAENDCCCDVVCSCFGDPHCHSFFNDYEVSQEEEGTYVMVNEGGYFLGGSLREPLGVTKDYTIKFGDTELLIKDSECVYGEGIYVNGELTDDTSEVDGVEYIRTTDRPNKSDKKPYHKNNKLNKVLAISPSFVRVVYGQYTTEVRCLRFEMTRGPHKGWWNRLDVTVRRAVDEVVGDPGCCPSNDIVYNKIGDPNKDQGFCFRHPREDGGYLPGAQDLTGSGIRRLSLRDQATKEIDPRELSNNNVLAETYSRIAGIPLYEAQTLIVENGRKAVTDLVRNMEENCKYYASDEVFDYSKDAHCEGGLTLEAKKPTQKKWTPIKFFPKNVNYCDNKVMVVYDHTIVSGNKKLDNTYQLRLTNCTPDKDVCGDVKSKPCQPFGGTRNLGVERFAYDSTLTDALMELLQFASEECVCENNPIQCVMLCMNTGSCPASGNCTD